MVTVADIYSYLCKEAPLELQMSFDNSGMQIGRMSNTVLKVLLALDITSGVIDEAVNNHVQLIITHHPIIFNKIGSVCDREPKGDMLLRLAENGIAVISMHTNLDIADGGVNDVLIRALGAEPEEQLDSDGLGRIGMLPEEMSMETFLRRCGSVLYTNGIRYYDSGKAIRKIAVLGGSGGSSLYSAVRKGCDTFITADVKYNHFLDAAELGINLIDGDHFGTEQLIIPVLADKLKAEFPSVSFSVSAHSGALIRFYTK